MRDRAAMGVSRRARATGQSIMVEWGLALALGVGTVLLWVVLRQGISDAQRTQAIADQTRYMADASTKFLVQNYTALEQWMSLPGAAQTMEFTPSCVGGGPCKMPAVGSVISIAQGMTGWKSLSDAGLIPPEQVNVDQAGQPYRIVVHCAVVTNLSCTQLSAIVVTFGGPPLNDNLNGRIAHEIGSRAGFIPNNAAITGFHEAPAWLTNYNKWSVGGTPRATKGNIAVSLDYDIGNDAYGGQIHRFGSGDDTRTETMGRTMYMARNSTNQSPANVCFCGSDGFFHGLCLVPGTVEFDPKDACGVPP